VQHQLAGQAVREEAIWRPNHRALTPTRSGRVRELSARTTIGAALGAEGAMADRGVRRIEGLDDDANSKAPFAANLRMNKIPTPGAAPRRAARGSSENRPSAFFETAPKTPAPSQADVFCCLRSPTRLPQLATSKAPITEAIVSS
jgi:hypothetical protein